MIAKKDLSVFREKQRILLKTNDFICLLPHQNLREYISNYNITFPTSILMPDSFTEMPCGCATLTVECCRSNLSVHLDGPTTRPHIVGNQANRLEILVTIEFKPAGFFALTGIPQNELTDVSLPFEAVNPKLCRLISQAVEKAGSICELADNLDLLLSESMHMVHQPQLSIALQTIINCSGNVNVKNLSADTHYSERQLNRIFN